MGYFKQEQQQDASLQRGMPVDVVADTSRLVQVTGEVVTFSYYLAGVLTTDGGEAAGTNVIGKFQRTGILNDVGDVIGTNKNTSINITAGTALTTEKPFPYLTAELYDEHAGVTRLDRVIAKANLENGEYVVDYRNGVVYGKKADASVSLTADYKVSSQSTTSSGGGPTADVNVNEWGGSATTLGQKAMASSVPVVISSDQSTINVNDGGNTTLLAGSKVVVTAGVPETLIGAPTNARSVVIQAKTTNTGNVLVGDVTNQDVLLFPGDSASIDIDDLQKIYVDTTVNGEGVNYLGSV